jgi:hypothetical protein
LQEVRVTPGERGAAAAPGRGFARLLAVVALSLCPLVVSAQQPWYERYPSTEALLVELPALLCTLTVTEGKRG